MSVALITSLYGDLDTLKDPPVIAGVDDYIAVVGEPHPQGLWRQVVEPRPHLSNRMASKVPKCLVHAYTHCDIVIWIDASATARNDLAEWATQGVDVRHPLAQFVHPERDDAGDEAKVSATMKKYKGLALDEQVAYYQKLGFPEHWGLWATGCMVRFRCMRSVRLGGEWLKEQTRWGYQDQVSEPYVLWSLGLRPVPLEGSLWHSPNIQFAGHRTDD